MSRTNEIVLDAVVGIVTAYLLSVLFWLVFGVFQLTGFIVWSLVTGAVGGILGGFVLTRPWGPILLAAVVRVAWFAVATGFTFGP